MLVLKAARGLGGVGKSSVVPLASKTGPLRRSVLTSTFTSRRYLSHSLMVRSTTSSNGDENDNVVSKPGSGGSWWSRLWAKDAAQATDPNTNRWLMVIPGVAAHACVGSPYAWSVMSGPLSRFSLILSSRSLALCEGYPSIVVCKQKKSRIDM